MILIKDFTDLYSAFQYANIRRTYSRIYDWLISGKLKFWNDDNNDDDDYDYDDDDGLMVRMIMTMTMTTKMLVTITRTSTATTTMNVSFRTFVCQ